MVLLWFSLIPTLFRLRKNLSESAIQVLSNPWLVSLFMAFSLFFKSFITPELYPQSHSSSSFTENFQFHYLYKLFCIDLTPKILGFNFLKRIHKVLHRLSFPPPKKPTICRLFHFYPYSS